MKKIPLLLLPGTLCDSRLWSHQVSHLSNVSDIQVCDITEADTIEEMAASVLEKAPPRFALAGLSLGGIVAIEITRQAPERVIKLALLNTTANPPYLPQQKNWEKLIDAVQKGKFIEVVQQNFIPNLLYQQHPLKESLNERIFSMATSVGETAYLNQLKAVSSKPDGFKVLPNIECDTLLIVGKEDALCTVKMHEEMQVNIPHSHLVVIEECGHLSTMEQPLLVTSAMKEWLVNGNEKNTCRSCEKCTCTSKEKSNEKGVANC
ncbi:alpha/beta fold hydrolase [Sporosarcina newyorkensis]|uniref:Pimeloyl-ACP methyl ester carboxylesterase n=1 Tax=Sporosarcina newyorkensis TaxID=759851 RepID=A0A1T4YUW6_9BACL|nr:alpha/beta hydrolase [Sporosarcina newyorkensis]SKB05579.1 Pimeloyl-ACP methyl ester carboxylesterase [Sporosarcina newyorkensis]